MRTLLLALILVASNAIHAPIDSQLIRAVLRHYHAQFYEGVGIAYPEQGKPIALLVDTVVPTADRLELFGRGNPRGCRDYRKRMSTDEFQSYLENSRSVARLTEVDYPKRFGLVDLDLSLKPPGIDLMALRRRGYEDAVAISLPGFNRSRTAAVIYLEGAVLGAGRVYHLRKAGDAWGIECFADVWELH